MHYPKSTFSQRWARRLINCYPASWRQRYAEEMLLILEDMPPTPKTLLNLLVHLCDAYFHQDLVTGRTPFMLEKTRLNALAIYGATLIFLVPWMFVRAHFIDFAHRVLFPGISLADPFSATITRAVTYLLLIIIVLGGVPILLAAILQALKDRRFGTLLLCLLSLISPPVIVFIALGMTAGSTVLSFILPFSILFGLGLSLALIIYSVRQVAPNQRVTNYALALAAALPLVMLLGLVALMLQVVPFLLTLFQTGPRSYLLRESLLILLMVGACVLSIIALKKGFEAKRVAQGAQESVG